MVEQSPRKRPRGSSTGLAPLARGARRRKRGPGQPPHEPTDQTRLIAEMLTVFGATHERIALALSIDPGTLRKHYRSQLDHAFDRAATIATAGLVRRLRSADMQAIRFFLERRGGELWRAPPGPQLGDGEPVAGAPTSAVIVIQEIQPPYAPAPATQPAAAPVLPKSG